MPNILLLTITQRHSYQVDLWNQRTAISDAPWKNSQQSN